MFAITFDQTFDAQSQRERGVCATETPILQQQPKLLCVCAETGRLVRSSSLPSSSSLLATSYVASGNVST